MPYYTDSKADNAMPSGMDDGGGDDAPEGQPEEKEMGSETALIPKTLLAGKEFNPGDELVLKIVAMHGDEVEVAYATEEKDEHEGMDERQSGMHDRLSAMADKM